MMLCMNKIWSRACRALTVLLLISLVAFSFMFFFYAHLHILSDGRVIVHSHALPKSDQSGHQHTHSNMALLAFDAGSNLKTLLVPYLYLLPLLLVFSSLKLTTTRPVFYLVDHLFAQRAPPYFM